MHKLLLASILATAGLGHAQCGTLSVTGSGAAGSDLTVALSGATADSFAVVFVAENTGTTALQFGPLFTLNLGLESPVIPLPLGGTDANGDVSVTFTVPTGATTQYQLNAQAGTFTVSFMPFSISACESNVVPVAVGG